MDQFEKELIKKLQYDFPLSLHPFREIAESMGVSEEKVLETIKKLKEKKIIRRIGAILNKEKVGYKSLLIAIKVYEKQDEVINYLNSLINVTHNYLRDNEWNIWFTFNYNSQEQLDNLIKKLDDFKQVEDYLLLPSKKNVKIDARF